MESQVNVLVSKGKNVAKNHLKANVGFRACNGNGNGVSQNSRISHGGIMKPENNIRGNFLQVNCCVNDQQLRSLNSDNFIFSQNFHPMLLFTY